MARVNIKYFLPFIAVCLALPSCSDRDKAGGDRPADSDIVRISVATTTRVGEDDGDADSPGVNSQDIKTEFTEFNDKSVLHISQMTRSLDPYADGNQTYEYIYNGNTSAKWDDGFNFVPLYPNDEKKILMWEDIRTNQTVGNGFALFAMYYPVDYQTPRYSVEPDQSKLEYLQMSDILGAYHSTASLYSRLRFRLHHLMDYIQVNLYVPVYMETFKHVDEAAAADADDGGGDTPDADPGKTQGMSGFHINAIEEAVVAGVYTDFSIDWRANQSSDVDGPKVLAYDPTKNQGTASGDAPDDNPAESTKKEPVDIKMYRHEEIPTDEIEIEIAKYLPKEMLEIQPLDGPTDKVRRYSFSVIIPIQPGEFAQGSILRFTLANPTGAASKVYYFKGIFNSGSGNTFDVSRQGQLNVLDLYVPRKGAQLIQLKAKVAPWTDVDTDMNLSKQDSSTGQN